MKGSELYMVLERRSEFGGKSYWCMITNRIFDTYSQAFKYCEMVEKIGAPATRIVKITCEIDE